MDRADGPREVGQNPSSFDVLPVGYPIGYSRILKIRSLNRRNLGVPGVYFNREIAVLSLALGGVDWVYFPSPNPGGRNAGRREGLPGMTDSAMTLKVDG